MSTATQPKYFRAGYAMGADRVERRGGRFGYGLIEGVSIISRGEALGHDLWIDNEFVQSVSDSINTSPDGVKARFTHPGLSSDGVGQKLGRVFNASVVDGRVIADLHLQEAATKTPDGDLADYVMTLAEETPEDFGISIVFEHDMQAQEDHFDEHTRNKRFVSPDEDNKRNYPHARLESLRSADIVDSPAANPLGLFQRKQDAAQDGESYLSYVLGLSDAKPESPSFLGVDGDRAKQFLARFLERHNLSVHERESTVTKEVQTPDAVVETPQQSREEFKAELNRYVSAFGAANGAKWLAEDIDFQEAQSRHIELLEKRIEGLNAQVEELKDALQAIPRGDDEGVEFDAEPEAQPKTFGSRIRIQGKNYN